VFISATMAEKSTDHLLDILKQLEARKTVKPEDVTRARAQYEKVLDNIRSLKADIEFFKTNNKKENQQVNKLLIYVQFYVIKDIVPSLIFTENIPGASFNDYCKSDLQETQNL